MSLPAYFSEKQLMERSEKMILKYENKTLYETLFKYRNIFLDIAMICLSVVFLAITANIRIPLWPVPVTMQTFGVFLIAFFFGSKKGAMSIISYIIAGLLGLGVFAGYKSGISALLGPTAGYIIGFLFMTIIIGWMIEHGYGRTKKSVLLCILISEITLYSLGLTGLWLYLRNASLLKVLQLGFFPFIIGDIVKAILAIGLFPYLWKGAEKITQ